jgi:predicted acylesterase/phospholipase RssA
LIFGTSTGSIIGALIALGRDVDTVQKAYQTHVPRITSCRTRSQRSLELQNIAALIFGDATFTDVKTDVGVVAAKWNSERPMIFKSNLAQAHGSKETFVPGFGVSVSEAVQSSCSAYPFFDRKVVTTQSGDSIELIDGGYCANNPTLYAIADAVGPLKKARGDVRVLSIGVGTYPQPRRLVMSMIKRIPFNSIELLQKTLEINTQSMDQLRSLLFKDIATIRISDTFAQPEMATDLLEHDLRKLNLLRQRGKESFGFRENELRAFFTE